MEQIHKDYGLESVPFTIPDSIVQRTICTKSGKLAVDGLCNKYEGGSTVATEYFAKNTEPTEKCDVHVKVSICTVSNKIANDFCPKATVKEKVLLSKDETSKTMDTPYILTKDTCNVHNAKNSGLPNIIPTPTPITTPPSGTPPVTTPPITTPPDNSNTGGTDDGNTDNGNNGTDNGSEEIYDPEFNYNYGH